MNAEIQLSTLQMAFAARWGRMRHAEHTNAGRADGKVMADGEDVHVQGAQAEYAFARAAGLAWSGRFLPLETWDRERLGLRDVGQYQIRSTRHPQGALILHPSDKDDDVFVLARAVALGRFAFPGWTRGRDGKRREYWRDVGYGRPCFYVPASALQPLEALP